MEILVEHPYSFEAVQEENQKRYRILGTGSYLPLLPGQLTPSTSAEESLLPDAWCPQRDLMGFALPQH
jgi:hypothetical protein